jgi:hypothetical protein
VLFLSLAPLSVRPLELLLKSGNFLLEVGVLAGVGLFVLLEGLPLLLVLVLPELLLGGDALDLGLCLLGKLRLEELYSRVCVP